jgi:amidase
MSAEKNMKIERREFIGITAASLLGLAGTSSAQRKAFDLTEKGVAELTQLMAAGKTSSAEITAGYLARIRTFDKKVNSIIELNPDALAIARELDAERRAKKVRGSLHGIPVLIKDNLDTADKMKTTAGSLALVDSQTPKQDSFVVEKLRAAGAVILGKTNLSEWANFRDGASTSGWSGRGGQTHNPYVLDRNACGSSSGTGAAIAANFATVGIGTETDGSIVCPSSINGIVGIKPTVGLISRSGIIPISASQDTAGPMCRTVADAAIVLQAIMGRDPNDPATSYIPQMSFSMKADALRGARIGVARDFWGKRADLDAVLSGALEAMKKAGAILIDVRLPNLTKIDAPEGIVLQYEFKDGLEKYLRARNAKYRTLDDLIKFNKDNAAKELTYFGQSIFEASAKRGDLNSKEYTDALAASRKYSRDEGIDQALKENKLDAIVAPANAPTWLTDLVNGDCFSGYVGSSTPAAVAGYPNVTVPAGFIRELPIGVSFIGRAWSEPSLINIAYSFEQATKARRRPKFLATAVNS